MHYRERKECPECGKLIQGSTKDQVDYLMKQHHLARHAARKEKGAGRKI